MAAGTVLHDAAIVLLSLSIVAALGAYVVGRWQYSGGGRIPPGVVRVALFGVGGVLFAVALLAVQSRG